MQYYTKINVEMSISHEMRQDRRLNATVDVLYELDTSDAM
jgi:hypothetical protein